MRFGGVQTQIFASDALERTLTVTAAGGDYGAYSHRSHGYSTLTVSQLSRRNDATRRHALTHIGGAQKH